MTPAPVVAAAILDSLAEPTRLLSAARAYPAELAGRFELPGGKINAGEDALDALAREIDEELGATLSLGPQVPTPEGTCWPILGGRRMGVWLAELAPGSPAPRAGDSHLELRWTPLDEVAGLDWIGADLPIALAVVAAARARAKRR